MKQLSNLGVVVGASAIAAAFLLGGSSFGELATANARPYSHTDFRDCVDLYKDSMGLEESIEACCDTQDAILVQNPATDRPYDCVGMSEDELSPEPGGGQSGGKPGVPGAPGPVTAPPMQNPGQPTKAGAPLPTVPVTGRA